MQHRWSAGTMHNRRCTSGPDPIIIQGAPATRGTQAAAETPTRTGTPHTVMHAGGSIGDQIMTVHASCPLLLSRPASFRDMQIAGRHIARFREKKKCAIARTPSGTRIRV
ncbi:hypothetical protein PVAP13_1NG181419 [Panicum virgatum]|uniref:Uncharacterized protein n=1 Tax=Panicum virgatum TaxID=38727 RepID=A0A8T0WXX8_PANVG|nr:hypothetical protein PVAP13_1NG181419 [Panicum virgatum]